MVDGLWNTISRYSRYFITIILGIFLNAFAPIAPLFKRPITAIAIIGLFIGVILFFFFTFRAMLGLSPVF
jgi:sensor histidine kinase regulating citrate/malate metabolism